MEKIVVEGKRDVCPLGFDRPLYEPQIRLSKMMGPKKKKQKNKNDGTLKVIWPWRKFVP